MQMGLDEPEAEALRLAPEERAKLAQRLLRSQERSAEAEIDRLWIEEAERRHRDLDTGAESIPAAEALARARAALK